MEKQPRWDIFCAVVDNYGDAAVCWRLARQLAVEHRLPVRLWIDDLRPLARLCPAVTELRDRQSVAGVDIRAWPARFPQTETADVVIEAFACELPDGYLRAMCERAAPPAWINLEYLSAEGWIEDCHARTSPHPGLPLERSFFFPGFTPATGGLLRERDYAEQRARFDLPAFRSSLGVLSDSADALTVSLFGYRNPAIGRLLQAWSQSAHRILCLVPESVLLADIRPFFGTGPDAGGTSMRRGNLVVQVLPFLSQTDYDRLLWLCDLNFVRGEDSFVRAQWAEKPFVWQPYPQTDEAHRAKLDAFLDRYLDSVAPAAAAATRDFAAAWNGAGDAGEAWVRFRAALPILQAHAPVWAGRIGQAGELAANLLAFAGQRLALGRKIG